MFLETEGSLGGTSWWQPDDRPEASTGKQVQHTLVIFQLSDFTKPNKRNRAKWSHKGGYPLNKSTQDFAIYP